jgi:hypothetical protein
MQLTILSQVKFCIQCLSLWKIGWSEHLCSAKQAGIDFFPGCVELEERTDFGLICEWIPVTLKFVVRLRNDGLEDMNV